MQAVRGFSHDLTSDERPSVVVGMLLVALGLLLVAAIAALVLLAAVA